MRTLGLALLLLGAVALTTAKLAVMMPALAIPGVLARPLVAFGFVAVLGGIMLLVGGMVAAGKRDRQQGTAGADLPERSTADNRRGSLDLSASKFLLPCPECNQLLSVPGSMLGRP